MYEGAPSVAQDREKRRLERFSRHGLERWGIGFSSNDHQWRWQFDEIRVMERESRTLLKVETFEIDVLGLGKPKNYRFELDTPMRDEDWSRSERLRH